MRFKVGDKVRIKNTFGKDSSFYCTCSFCKEYDEQFINTIGKIVSIRGRSAEVRTFKKNVRTVLLKDIEPINKQLLFSFMMEE